MTAHLTYGDTLRDGDHLAVRDLARRWARCQGLTNDTANAFAAHYVGEYVEVGQPWRDLPAFPVAFNWAMGGHDPAGRCLTDWCPEEAH